MNYPIQVKPIVNLKLSDINLIVDTYYVKKYTSLTISNDSVLLLLCGLPIQHGIVDCSNNVCKQLPFNLASRIHILKTTGVHTITIREPERQLSVYEKIPPLSPSVLQCEPIRCRDLRSRYQVSNTMNICSDELQCINHSSMNLLTPINQIAMLGSHDAGTYSFSANLSKRISLGRMLPSAFKTQKLTLVEQAKVGVTYFDIRVTKVRGVFQFFHGPSSAGDALSDVKKLMEYVKNDPDNIYLFKMDLKKHGEQFLNLVLSEVQSNLITLNDTGNLGSTPIKIMNEMKNIGIMLKTTNGINSEKYWDYSEQKHTRWAKSSNVNRTIAIIRDFHQDPVPVGRLNIIQTNMLGGSTYGGVKGNLNINKDKIADAIELIQYPSIISGDYIGTSIGATKRFIKIINRHNRTKVS